MIGRNRNLSTRQEAITFGVKGSGPYRLDRYLGTSLSWKSRSRIQALIHQGRVHVNDEPAKPSRRVRAGDRITVALALPDTAPPDYEALKLQVLYEDPWLVAVNKPPGLLVHPTGRHVYDTLINYLHHRYRDARTEGGDPVRPRLCHRIDKETTGVVVIGTDPYVHNELRHQFESRRVSKEYQTLVRGEYPADGAVAIPIGEGHDLTSSLDHPLLRPSRTDVRILRRFHGFTLLSCVPATGRQNQIRIHLAATGFPIVGDERFGSDLPPAGFPRRYLLHSRRLEFLHPRLKARARLSAPLPGDFAALLERLTPRPPPTGP